MTMKEIKKKSGMNYVTLSWVLGIPVRTLTSWCNGERKCPDYVVRLIEYYMDNHGYLSDDDDDSLNYD